jgi:GT2 family glycosyltransferase
MPYAPIALFVYNRPLHTARTITALRRNPGAAQSDLIVFSDAARTPQAESSVREVRALVAGIDGFKSVSIVERTQNWGLARSIVDGVTRLTEERGRVIVLEDDLETSSYFLAYMNAALDRYEAEERVMQIAGYMYPAKPRVEEDALFLPFISSWGWGTWRRAWRHFKRREEDFPKVLADRATRRRFDLNGHYKFSKILRAYQRGRVDSWAIHWYVTVFLREGLALFPTQTLVQNLGFDGSGVNCFVGKLEQGDLDAGYRAAVFPRSIEVSPQAAEVMRNIPPVRTSLQAVVKRLTRAMRP